jgi:hypothetical protein
MSNFIIIEVEDGFMVVQVGPDETPEDGAVRHGGMLVDPGPYATFEDATDAMNQLEPVGDEDESA